ncbi:unnamed protein product [Chironomus riparius]|uniref:Fatty acyl-CoA reductase n=1 Tax=Chironomus riparius TaxID=315576 RepID=A0A9N9S5S9_9DIPT|nr:unnamed protein product [Chironomus riparius]
MFKLAEPFNHVYTEGGYVSIPEFYSGKSVFVTGATGSIGKILIEKFLRSCPDIKRIYILIRPKKGVSIQNRLSQIFNVPLFDLIRENNPDAFEKVIPIFGDIKADELGISPEDQNVLCQEVSIVIHSAATIRFDEELKEAFEVNVKGTQKLVNLSKRMTKIESFVYISTAFSNCTNKDIHEKFYEFPFDTKVLNDFIEKFPVDVINKCTKFLIGKHPNTYTFSKAMAEVSLKNVHEFPVVVLRPSIVTACYKEPLPGWVDNLLGPTALIATNGKGIVHTFLCRPDIPIDCIPADLVVNSVIAVGWRSAILKPKEHLIYNITSSNKNAITWREVLDNGSIIIKKYPFENMLWYPTKHFGTNKFIYNILVTIIHNTPAHIIDFIFKLSGRKPFLVKIQDKFYKSMEFVEFFKFTQFFFHGNNVDKLISTMNEDDKKNFDFDATHIDWIEYIRSFVLGVRRYIFKEDPKTIESCRKRLFKLKILHEFMKLLMIFFCLWIVWKLLDIPAAVARFTAMIN